MPKDRGSHWEHENGESTYSQIERAAAVSFSQVSVVTCFQRSLFLSVEYRLMCIQCIGYIA